jgi:hypothetical protein
MVLDEGNNIIPVRIERYIAVFEHYDMLRGCWLDDTWILESCGNWWH